MLSPEDNAIIWIGDFVKTIKESVSKEYIIQKSKFITKLYPISKEEDIEKILEELHVVYHDATHICYAYIFNNRMRANDDGEPGGTAGLPMLNVLEKQEFQNILGVIIRYFGGIKLGAGGLVRAYSNCLASTIAESKIVNLVPGIILELTCTYDNLKLIENLLVKYSITNKNFLDKIHLEVHIPIEEYNLIKDILQSYCLSIIEKERLNIPY